MNLEGKVAVVLGASAKGGIGWTTAEALAAEGAMVIVAARRIDPLRRLAKRIGGHAVQCDSTRPDDIEHLARVTVAEHGIIDIAVNAAGESAIGNISDIDPALVQQSITVNYLAHFHFVRNMTQAMRHGGAITLISTALSVQPVANRFAYGCAKAALDCLGWNMVRVAFASIRCFQGRYGPTWAPGC